MESVAATIAYDTMSYYTGNLSSTPETIATLPEPYYWWEAGALWGAMIDYQHYTGDLSYQDTVIEALLSQVGPEFNYMNPIHFKSTGNDDQAFWGFAVLSAAEQNLPQPHSNIPSWVQLGENLWNSMVTRWNTSNCGGGFTWQIFAENPNGRDYKNSVSNGGFFLISARLARVTGNNTYTQWATKVWNWSEDVGFVGPTYRVYDGAHATDNCTVINKLTFTYTHGIYLYGAAIMANLTNETSWSYRVGKMLDAADRFFSPYENATAIMYEQACETVGSCNVDMKSFKGYLARFMWKTSQMLPSFSERITKLLTTTAVAAANACTGGDWNSTCGQKWYVNGFDHETGLGQQMCALEVIQGLLVTRADPPLSSSEVVDTRPHETDAEAPPAASKRAEQTKDDEEDASVSLGANFALIAVTVGSGILILAL